MPDKLAPQVVTIPNVKLVRTGTWLASTGMTTITRDDLDDMVTASSDPDVDEAVVKLGHTDPINAGLLADGIPALGWVTNLRVEDEAEGGRSVLVGDLSNVPEPLAQVLPLAYKRRSAEIAWVVKTAGGNRYRAALTGLSLLGKFAPAVKGLGEPIEDLEDLYALYGLAKPEERVLESALSAERVSALMGAEFDAETKRLNREASRTNAEQTSELADAINIETIREAWRDAHPYDPEEPSSDTWVREVWLEPGTMGGYLIVEGGDTEPDELLRVAWSAEDDGAITLGAQEKVRVTYEPAKLAARSAIYAQLKAKAIDRDTMRTLLSTIPIPSSAKNPPHSGEPGDNDENDTPTGGRSMDTKRLEELLANEDEAAAVEAFKKLRAESTPAPEGDGETTPPAGGDGGETDGKPDGSTQTPPEAEPTATAEADAEDPLLVKLSAGSWTEVKDDLKAGREAMRREHERDVKAAVRSALSEGRISPEPKEVEAWTDRLDKDLEGTKALLSTLQPRFSTYELGDDSALEAHVDDAAFDAFERSVFGADFGASNEGGK